jgi:hypothetical protein
MGDTITLTGSWKSTLAPGKYLIEFKEKEAEVQRGPFSKIKQKKVKTNPNTL